jgi:hypothetical protein
MWPGREADAPLRTPRSRQSPFCRDESRPDICWWSELESNQPFGFFRPALIRLSYPTELERAVRVELTNTGFAIQCLSHLATRANWNGRRGSNSRDEFGRLACFQLHHFRENGRGGQSRTVTTSSQDSDANVTPHPELKMAELNGLEPSST